MEQIHIQVGRNYKTQFLVAALKYFCFYHKFLKRPIHPFTVLHGLHLGTIVVLAFIMFQGDQVDHSSYFLRTPDLHPHQNVYLLLRAIPVIANEVLIFLTTGGIVYALRKKILYKMVMIFNLVLMFLKFLSLNGLFMMPGNRKSNLPLAVYIFYTTDTINTFVYFGIICYYIYRDYRPTQGLVLIREWDWNKDIWSDKLDYKQNDQQDQAEVVTEGREAASGQESPTCDRDNPAIIEEEDLAEEARVALPKELNPDAAENSLKVVSGEVSVVIPEEVDAIISADPSPPLTGDLNVELAQESNPGEIKESEDEVVGRAIPEAMNVEMEECVCQDIGDIREGKVNQVVAGNSSQNVVTNGEVSQA